MRDFNPIIDLLDSYKIGHWAQTPPETSRIYSYIEARGGKFPETVFFGLQAYLEEYLSIRVQMGDVEEAREFCEAHGEPFNYEGWTQLVMKHGGRYPVEIRAVREGSLVPTGNVLVDIVNTDPNFAWLTSVLETSLLRAVWYPSTVATTSFRIKRIIKRYLEKTADDLAMHGIDYKLNDFGARGVSSLESAVIGGLAHLAVFKGTDNMAAVRAARRFYREAMAGHSIPASEHSTMTSWGGRKGEVNAMRNMLKFAPKYKLIACVSDSFDIFNATENIWGGELLEEVRQSGSTLVVRPDSGDPVATPVRVIEILMEKAGFTVNSKGYKMLPDYFRVIQGDGIDEETIEAILSLMESKAISADNIAFGMGGALLQKMDRDTGQWAMKASAIEIDGRRWDDVYKDPIGQPNKKSKKGRLELVLEDGQYKTVRREEFRGWRDQEITRLEVVYHDGEIRQSADLAEVRSRVNSNLG